MPDPITSLLKNVRRSLLLSGSHNSIKHYSSCSKFFPGSSPPYLPIYLEEVSLKTHTSVMKNRPTVARTSTISTALFLSNQKEWQSLTASSWRSQREIISLPKWTRVQFDNLFITFNTCYIFSHENYYKK